MTGVNYTYYPNWLQNVYEIFCHKKYITATCIHKWNEMHQRQEEEWGDIFITTFKVVRETKLQSFQFKLIHRIINCNDKIYDMKIKASPQCSYCDEIDDTSHFCFHCLNVRHLWYLFCQTWNGKEYHRVNVPNYPDVYDILFGIKNMNDGHEVLNFCILHIKYYIYKQRLFHDNTLSIRDICNEIQYKLDIERKIYENDDKQMNSANMSPCMICLTPYKLSQIIPFTFRDIHIKGVMPQIINYPLILRHIYSFIIAQDTSVYQMQEPPYDCKHICIMYDENMYV